ncbi:MAG: tetratricopeptide repeat protein [Acidobacteria bacterium]|nr:tetratricopeptide repeat protein [Acidobacteriota bacterium]
MIKQFIFSLLTVVCLVAFTSITNAQVANPNGTVDPTGSDTFLKPLRVPKAKKLSKLKTPEEYFARATESFSKGDFDIAILDYDEAIRKKPDYAEAFLERGNVYMAKAATFFNKDDRMKGFADFREAIKLKPNNVEAYFNLGVAYYRLDNFDDAIEAFSQVIRIQPNYFDAYNNRAYAYRKKGNLDQALGDFTEAIKINPEFSEAILNRGLIYKGKGDKEKAIEDFKAVVKLAKVANAVVFAKQELIELGVDIDEYKE